MDTLEQRLNHLEKLVFRLLQESDGKSCERNICDTTYKMYQNANEKLSRIEGTKGRLFILLDRFVSNLKEELNKI